MVEDSSDAGYKSYIFFDAIRAAFPFDNDIRGISDAHTPELSVLGNSVPVNSSEDNNGSDK